MFPLIETAIGFVAIMLMLTLLVKSLTSLINNHFDFYCDNLNYEVDQFLRGVLKKSLAELKADATKLEQAPWLKDFDLSRVGDEFFSEENIKSVLKDLAEPGQVIDMSNLKGRLAAHVSRVKYMFGQRVKNLAFAVGVGLCLLIDVNAVTIWRTLYTNETVRTAFASEAATAALLESGQPDKTPQTASAATGDPKTAEQDAAVRAQTAAELAEARKQFRARLHNFTTEVNFGVGRVWHDPPPTRTGWFYEFLGALVTGLLVSVGAPYWHDILENLGSLRKGQTPT